MVLASIDSSTRSS